MTELGRLYELQQALKREFLLAEKEQQEKKKHKQMIDESIRKYYSEYASTVTPEGRITTDEGLQNCYNFIKQTCILLAKDIQLGLTLLLDTSLQDDELIAVIINLLYENIAQPDYYKKPINRLMSKLLHRLIQVKNFNFLQKITKIFLKRIDIKEYFNKVSTQTITRLMRLSFKRPECEMRKALAYSQMQRMSQTFDNQSLASTHSTSFSHQLGINYNEQQKYMPLPQIKKDIFKKYAQELLDEATTAPIELKTLLKILYDNFVSVAKLQQSQARIKLWQLIKDCYLQPFNTIQGYLLYKLNDNQKKQIVQEIGIKLKQHALSSSSFLPTLISNLMNVNEEKLKKYINGQDLQESHVVTLSVCLSYRQIYTLFTLIRKNQSVFKQKSSKLIARLSKVYEMSEELQILTKNKKHPASTYLLFTQLQLSSMMTIEYLKDYSETYKDSMLKNILRQVLVELDFTQETHGINTLSTFFEQIVRWQEKQNFMANASLITKVKYLSWIIQKNKIEQKNLLDQMISECKQRVQQNVRIYEKSKFCLLKTYSNIRNRNISLSSLSRQQILLMKYLKNIQIIQNCRLSFCITSPSVRSSQFPEQMMKLRMSQSSKIIIENPDNCIHQQNIFLGLPYHANSAKQFLSIFTQLKQVRMAIETNIDIFGIKTSLFAFIEDLKKICEKQYKLSAEQMPDMSKTLQNIVMRSLHLYLIERNTIKSDQEFYRCTLRLSHIKARWLCIPLSCNMQHTWQICSKHISNLIQRKTPDTKMAALKEVLQIIKITLYYQEKQEQYTQVIIRLILMRAQPKNLISNLNFIQLFLPQSKLLSIDGSVLRQFRIAAQSILSNSLQFCFTEEGKEEFQRQSAQNQIMQGVQILKKTTIDF